MQNLNSDLQIFPVSVKNVRRKAQFPFVKNKSASLFVVRSFRVGAFFDLRALVTLLLCGSECLMVIPTISGLGFFRPDKAATMCPRTLTFAGRVAYQRAIEEVYWRHRIWPKLRADPKPSLDAVISQAQLEKKVEDYLRESQQLEDYWQRPITAEQLQAEMHRMAQHTKQPDVLRELFGALGNDPFVIAECLARPVLSMRLVRDFYAHDQKLECELNRQAKSWQDSAETDASRIAAIHLTGGAVQVKRSYQLPRISSGAECSDDTWTATSITKAASARAGHTAVWTGSEMIVWGGYGGSYFNTGARYDPSTDSWVDISTINAPPARGGNTAVWTGSEMIIWGGDDGQSVNTGGRYNPATATWIAPTTINAPAARFNHTAGWSGNEMIVWGGWNGTSSFSSGGKYNPNTDSWTVPTTTMAPTARYYHTAVWTGSEMIVWGGWNGANYFNTGGKYNPGTDSWTATSTSMAPAGRYYHTAVWAGNDMIVWGGDGGVSLDSGGRYNPNSDSWRATSVANAPTARYSHTAVSTGNEMIIWGGYNGSYLNTGGRYCAQSASPTPTATPTPTPTARPNVTPRLRPTPPPRR